MREQTMSRLRRPAVAVAATALALAMGVPFAASPAYAAIDDNVDVTINGLTAGDTVTFYTVATAGITNNSLVYNFDADLTSYNTVAAYKDANGNIFANNSAEARTAANALAGQAANLTQTVVKDGSADDTDNAENGSITAALAPGYYLAQVTSTSGTTKVYNNMLINTVGTYEDGTYTDATVAASTAKSEEPGNPAKQIGTTAGATTTDGYSVGDTIPFTLTSAIPNYPANSSKATYAIGDEPTGIIIDADSVVVKVNDSEVSAGSTTYSATLSNSKLTITFVKEYILANPGASVVVTYNGVLTSTSADKGEATNSATISYTSNPFDPSSADQTPDNPGTTTASTYGYVFTKKLGSASGSYLDASGSTTFELYDSEGNVVYTVDDNGDKTTTARTATIASVENVTYVYIDGLAAGTYTLKESNPPAGYQAIDVEFTVDSATAAADNPATSTTEDYYLADTTTAKIDPDKGALPSTGDSGIYLLIAAGVVLVASGTVIVVISRSRRKEDR